MFTPEHAAALFTVCFLLLLWAEQKERSYRKKVEMMLRKYVRLELAEMQRKDFIHSLRKEKEE